MDAEAKEVAAALGEADDLEPLDKAHNELESINNAGSDAELEGIDE